MTETIIRSRQNLAVQRLREAARSHRNEFVIEGIKQIRDAINAGSQPLLLALSEDHQDLFPDVSARSIMTHSLLEYLSDTRSSQGAVALFAKPAMTLDSMMRTEGVLVVLDNIQDPGNAGTIVRLAAAFEASGIVSLDASADLFGPKAVRAAAGAVLAVPHARASTEEFISAAAVSEMPLFIADSAGTTRSLPVGRCALILGNEGHGISAGLSELAEAVAIPISKGVESLNVAAAAAILLSAAYASRKTH